MSLPSSFVSYQYCTRTADNPQHNMSHQDSEVEDTPVFHDKSKWEEPPGDPYLTLWDVNRIPRTVEAMDPNQRLRLPVKVLHPDFRCPICCGYLKKTTTVMECLHRFCEECIGTSLRLAKKECPTCRIRVPSRRSLRSDKRFDELIECILGDVEEQDRKEARQIELFNQGKLMSSTTMKTRQRKRRTPRELATREAKRKVAMPFLPSAPTHGFEVILPCEGGRRTVVLFIAMFVLRLTYCTRAISLCI
jgi:E3 ubiquitin-protein ligase RNF1/2